MNWLFRLPYRSLAVPFYEANAIFFMILIYFAFGILTGREHVIFATFIAQSLTLTIAIIFFWSFYNFKTYLFIIKKLISNEYRFMHIGALLPKNQLISFFIVAQFIVNLPVLLYAMFIMYYQVYFNEILNLAIFIVYIILSTVLPAIYYRKFIGKPLPEFELLKWEKLINRKIEKPFFIWYIFHLVKNRPGLLILSKMLSLLLFASFFILYGTDEYDWRVLGLGTLFGFSANAPLIFEHLNFFKHQLIVFKNLPIHPIKRLVYEVLTWFILLVPEFILAWRYFPNDQTMYLYILLMLFGYFLVLFYIQIPNIRNWSIEGLYKLHFFVFWILFVLILYNFAILPIILILALVFLLGAKRYYRLTSID